MAEIYLPVGSPIADPKSGRATDPMVGWMRQVTREIPSEGGAPADSEYLLGTLDADLPNGRQAIDSPEITVDLATPGQVSWALTAAARIVRRTTTTLTNAQILALPTTERTIIAAQGAGTRAVLLRADCVLNAAAGAYTNISADAYFFAITYAPAGGWVDSNYLANDSTLPITYFSTVFGAAKLSQFSLDSYCWAEPVNGWGNIPVSHDWTGGAPTNQPWVLQISNAALGNLTGGNAANTLVVNAYWALNS